jgi:arylsulfatase A-like enzyme
MPEFTRRDFLKLAATVSASIGLTRSGPAYKILSGADSVNRPGIIVLLFDAMSARHLSLYGYSRNTTPNLERFAQRATVYHSHYAGGSFTTPGTSSILMGMYPWTHRAINNGGLIKRSLVDQNMFSLMGNEYYRAAFTENLWADLFLRQFQKSLDEHIPPTAFEFSDKTFNPFLSWISLPDSDMIYYAFNQFMLTGDGSDPEQIPGSPLFGFLDYVHVYDRRTLDAPSQEYPYGVPYNNFYYFQIPQVLPDAADRIQQLVRKSAPAFGYFHFWSPHEPFRPRAEFVDSLADISIPDKPHHPLASNQLSAADYAPGVKLYDEYIADIDDGFGKLLDKLTDAGVFDNNYVVVTSDHGQLFERGDYGHSTALLFDSVIHVPLLISAPDVQTRRDVYAPTSAIDILPTLLHLAGRQIPAGLQGRLLPGFGGQEDMSRSVFSMDAKYDSAFLPFQQATISMVKGSMKLIYYLGYANYADQIELYNLQEDADELNDLRDQLPGLASQMKDELLAALSEANSQL